MTDCISTFPSYRRPVREYVSRYAARRLTDHKKAFRERHEGGPAAIRGNRDKTVDQSSRDANPGGERHAARPRQRTEPYRLSRRRLVVCESGYLKRRDVFPGFVPRRAALCDFSDSLREVHSRHGAFVEYPLDSIASLLREHERKQGGRAQQVLNRHIRALLPPCGPLSIRRRWTGPSSPACSFPARFAAPSPEYKGALPRRWL